MALLCRDCGVFVPEGAGICRRCNGVDLVEVKSAPPVTAGASGVEAYHRYEQRRRLARAATAVTTVVIMIVALGMGLLLKEAIPQAGGGSEVAVVGFFETLRVASLFLLFNPIILTAVGLILGLMSYRLWHRLFTGERAAPDFSMLDAMTGRAPAAGGQAEAPARRR